MKIWRPYTQMKTAPSVQHLDYAEGAFLYTRDGREIFDGISSWWLITHGHAQPEIAEAIAKQVERLEQAVLANFTHEPAEELTEILGRFLPKHLSHLFFSDNGSTSVEVAMKMAYQYMAQTGSLKKTKFIAFTKSYHGDTCGTMSVSGESSFSKPYRGMQFEILRAGQGSSVHDPVNVWTNHFEDLVHSHGKEVCAVIIEPLIQGAGGMIIWPIEAIQRIFDIAKQNEILVIFDEVMTGFGRTGSMFAFEQVERVPDFLCLSKGLTGGFLPMGLTVTTEQVFDAFLDTTSDKMFFHGHSFTGNALSCAAAVANLKLFEKIDLPMIVKEIGRAHAEELAEIESKHSTEETRICGTIGVLALKEPVSYGDSFSRSIHTRMLENGIFLRPLSNIIYLMPPFCAKIQDVKSAWKTLSSIL